MTFVLPGDVGLFALAVCTTSLVILTAVVIADAVGRARRRRRRPIVLDGRTLLVPRRRLTRAERRRLWRAYWRAQQQTPRGGVVYPHDTLPPARDRGR